jgi:hypothetical protein
MTFFTTLHINSLMVQHKQSRIELHTLLSAKNIEMCKEWNSTENTCSVHIFLFNIDSIYFMKSILRYIYYIRSRV